MLPTCDLSFTLTSSHPHPPNPTPQPSFHSFCKDELPPLSPLTIKTMPPSNRTSTPKKTPFVLNEIFSDQILDFETIEKKNRSGSKNPNLFEQLFCEHSNEFAASSPYFKRKPITPFDGVKAGSAHFEHTHRHLDFSEVAAPKAPMNPVLSSFTFPGFERNEQTKLSKGLEKTGLKPNKDEVLKKSVGSEEKEKKVENVMKTPQKEKNEVSTTASSEIKTNSPDEKKKSKSAEKEKEKKSPKMKKVESTMSSTDNGGCKCKKSKCLKLYCECFSNGLTCKDSCSCNNCSNKTIDNNTEREVAIQSLLSKNPNVFISKPNFNALVLNSNNNPEVPKLKKSSNSSNIEKVKKGCNCKKSQCQKKYCECYEAGIKCEDYCKCEECKNTTDGKKIEEERQNLVVIHEKKNKNGVNKEKISEREPALKKKRRLE